MFFFSFFLDYRRHLAEPEVVPFEGETVTATAQYKFSKRGKGGRKAGRKS